MNEKLVKDVEEICVEMLDQHHGRQCPLDCDAPSFGRGASYGWDAATSEFYRRARAAINALEAAKGGGERRKVIRKATMIELLAAIYEAEGWKRAKGESRTKRTQEVYTITSEPRRNRYVATPLAASPTDPAAPEPASETAPAAGEVKPVDWNLIARRMQRAGAPGTEEELEAVLAVAFAAASSPSALNVAVEALEAIKERCDGRPVGMSIDCEVIAREALATIRAATPT